ncbi:MAG: right-handed parallel beta-helix repeat-containing protein, partial [Flavisolibacter sp.]|nr:right-handed parallel beta-helix repeat-containing protein [Flavisolibacter sp.]
VRPLTSGVKATFKDSTIRLRLTKPQHLSIELNGSLRMPLFLFANPREANKPGRNTPNTIYFEGGKVHYPGTITLSDNQSVYIEGGAVVVGVIKAKGAKNIKVFGRGILDGTYNNRFNDSLFKTGAPDTALLRTMKGSYNRFLEFTDCENVTIEGITLHNSTSWQVVPIHSTNVQINNIKIVSDQASDDGIDIVRSKKVRIENCFIRTKDDCIAIKAHMNYPKSEAVDDVVVQNCTFWNALWGNGLEIGFELNAAEIKNIIFRNCDIIHVEAGAAISIHNAGTGHVKNVTFENIRIEDARQKLFDFAIFRSQYSEDGTRDPEERRRLYLNGAWDGVLMVPPERKAYHGQFRGHISDVVLKNISITGGLFPYSIFYGYDDNHAVTNVRVESLTVYGRKITNLNDAKFYLENAKSISLK